MKYLGVCNNTKDFKSIKVNRVEARLIAIKGQYLLFDDNTVLNIRKHTGFLRNLVIRKGYNTDEIMLNFVTSSYNEDAFLLMVQLLRERFPQITSIVNNMIK